MTRLKTSDIDHIESNLHAHDAYLMERAGHTLTGIAALACGISPSNLDAFVKKFQLFRIAVVPITAGLGVITTFSESVCAILRHMGFMADVTEKKDTAGMAEAFERGFDAVMMSDDDRFVAINLRNRKVVDNSEATGRAFSTALHFMAKVQNGRGLIGEDVLVMGCGPVGGSAAETLLNVGARVSLYDINPDATQSLQLQISHRFEKKKVQSTSNLFITQITSLDSAIRTHRYMIEATPNANTISDTELRSDAYIAAPGVPLGLSEKGREIISEEHLIHDPLELGVAVMAASLII